MRGQSSITVIQIHYFSALLVSSFFEKRVAEL